jgi:hypothetical protein
MKGTNDRRSCNRCEFGRPVYALRARRFRGANEPLTENSGLFQLGPKPDYVRTLTDVSKMPKTDMKPSLQYIVGDCQERGRNFDAQRFGGFQIDDECELGRLFDREVCWN